MTTKRVVGKPAVKNPPLVPEEAFTVSTAKTEVEVLTEKLEKMEVLVAKLSREELEEDTGPVFDDKQYFQKHRGSGGCWIEQDGNRFTEVGKFVRAV